MKILETLEVGPYQVNCTLVDALGKTLVIDPGAEAEAILAALQKSARTLDAILLTHAHFDHIGAVNHLEKAFPGVAVYVGEKDRDVLTHPLNQCPPDYPAIARPKNLRAAEKEAGAFGCEVLPTPGHTPGGVSYLFKDEKILFSGDTLFAGSVGRTDFPGGDMATLRESLRRLAALDEATRVIPGHGPETTIGDEKESNPFLQF